MHGEPFGVAVRRWGTATRRTLVGLGLGSGLGSVFALAEAKKKKGKKRKKKKCKAQPTATTCAGKCGPVKNNCKKTVSCGNCPDGLCCSGTSTCGACLAFVTSSIHAGDLGGLAGADAICQDLADEAGLPGEYRAWLGDTTGSPSTRFVRASVPYTLVNGTVIATNWGDLTDGQIAHAIDLNERGQAGRTNPLWTNVQTNGAAGGLAADGHCDDWTSSLGGLDGHIGNAGIVDPNQTGAIWTTGDQRECSEQRCHYCFQQR